MTKRRRISESNKNKMIKLNKGSFGRVYSDGISAHKISIYNFKNGVKPESINEILFLKQLKNKYLSSCEDIKYRMISNSLNIQITMSLAECDLHQFIIEKTLIERSEKWLILVHNTLNGLNYLYQNQILHLDIKPENILYFSDNFKLSDFNLTAHINDLNKNDRQGMTLCYRAPEIIIYNIYNNLYPDWKFNSRSDIWSLGCTFYEYISGEMLFPVRSDHQLLKELFLKTTELNTTRDPFSSVYFLERINLNRQQKMHLLSLKGYLEEFTPHTNNIDKWYNLIQNMLLIDPELRPSPIDLLRDFNIPKEKTESDHDIKEVNYLEYLVKRIKEKDQCSFFRKIKMISKMKYEYTDPHDLFYLWKHFWKSFNQKDLNLFLEVFYIVDLYLLTNNNHTKLYSYNDFYMVYMAGLSLIWKIRYLDYYQLDHFISQDLAKIYHNEYLILKTMDNKFMINRFCIEDDQINLDSFFDLEN